MGTAAMGTGDPHSVLPTGGRRSHEEARLYRPADGGRPDEAGRGRADRARPGPAQTDEDGGTCHHRRRALISGKSKRKTA